jgi:hypothetical protein
MASPEKLPGGSGHADTAYAAALGLHVPDTSSKLTDEEAKRKAAALESVDMGNSGSAESEPKGYRDWDEIVADDEEAKRKAAALESVFMDNLEVPENKLGEESENSKSASSTSSNHISAPSNDQVPDDLTPAYPGWNEGAKYSSAPLKPHSKSEAFADKVGVGSSNQTGAQNKDAEAIPSTNERNPDIKTPVEVIPSTNERNPDIKTPIPDERAIVRFEETEKQEIPNPDGGKEKPPTTSGYEKLAPPSPDAPLSERLNFAHDILQQLNAREEDRQNQRYAVRPLGRFTPEALSKSLTKFSRWLNGTNGGKIAKSVSKVLLGTGAVAAAGLTGGAAGMLFAPILFAGGVKSAVSGGIEFAQEFFCGLRRNPQTGRLEVSSSRRDRAALAAAKNQFFAQTEAELNDLRQRALAGEFTEDELIRRIDQLAGDLEQCERDQIIESENKVIRSEKARHRFRGIVSTAATVGAAWMHGVPLGHQDFDQDGVKHFVNWSQHGFGFEFTPQEMAGELGFAEGKAIMNPHEALASGYPWQPHQLIFRQLGHSLGGMPPNIALAGMGAALTGLVAKTAHELWPARRVDSPELYENVTIWRDRRNTPGHYYSGDYLPEGTREGFSPTLQENPLAKLDHFKEAQRYLESQPEDAREHAKLLAEQVGEMSDACRVSLCVPVAGHLEGKNIYNTLERYLHQKKPDNTPLDPDSFELVLYVNHPSDARPDATLAEIDRFKEDHPELNVKVMYEALPRDRANMRYIRKALTDATLLRHHDRGEHVPEHIFVSNDADCVGMSPYYIASYLDSLGAGHESENGKITDAVSGKLDFDPSIYVKYPAVHVGSRFSQYLDAAMRHPKDGSLPSYCSTGPNFAFTSSIYSAVGGYKERAGVTVGEDVDLGRAIKASRGGHTNVSYGKSNSLLYTSARRSVKAAEEGYAPAAQWNKLEFGSDDELRKEARPEVVDLSIDEVLSAPEKKAEFLSTIESFINQTINVYGLTAEDKNVQRALAFLDLDTQVVDGKVKINSADALINDLKLYHDEVGWQRYERNISERPGGVSFRMEQS